MNNNNLQPISVDQLPPVITSQVNSLAKLSSQVQRCLDDAKEARDAADIAASKDAGWSFFGRDKKHAIEALQESMSQMAQAQVSMAEAVKLVYENQQKLSAVAQYLVSLGVVSIAHNRTVVRQLEMKLRNAPESEINELGRQEIGNVIMQLKSQESLQDKVDEKVEQITSLQNQVTSLLDQVKTQKKTFFDTAGFKITLLAIILIWLAAVIITNLPILLNQ